jgi:hypothetical protein
MLDPKPFALIVACNCLEIGSRPVRGEAMSIASIFGYSSLGGFSMSISFVLAILALILAIVSGTTGRAPLWIAVALLALAIVIPGLPLR